MSRPPDESEKTRRLGPDDPPPAPSSSCEPTQQDDPPPARASAASPRPSEITGPDLVADLVMSGETSADDQPATEGSVELPTTLFDERYPTRLKPGMILFERYTLERRIGEGAMGTVWLARDRRLDCRVALKLIHEKVAQHAIGWTRFEREARVMAKLRHPNAAAVFDYARSGTLAYIAMEYVRGRNLTEVLEANKNQPMPLDWTIGVLDQLCEVLQQAHDHTDEDTRQPQPIIHRDLKPSNLMISDGDRPMLKVLDFGVAKISGIGSGLEPTLTSDGQFVGTVAYSSPEQIRGDISGAVGPRSDLYSVGVLLYQLLTGRVPFQGSLLAICADHQASPPPPFRVANPGARVAPEIEAVVMACLAKNPADRPASARELAARFRGAVDRSRRHRRRVLVPEILAVVATVLSIALVVGVLLLFWYFAPKASRAPVAANPPSVPGPPIEPPRKDQPPAAQPAPAPAALDGEALAAPVHSLLKRYCQRCHGVDFRAPGLDVVDRRSLVSARTRDGSSYLVPGQPETSALWRLIATGKMPPKKAPQPSAEEREQIRSWIAAGAPPARFPRVFLGESHTLHAIRDHLKQTPEADRPHQRYFTLAHLASNPAVSDEALRLTRAALAKTLNSLSRQPQIVPLRAVDEAATVYQVDLRDLGWEKLPGSGQPGKWPTLLHDYPYGLKLDEEAGGDVALQSVARQVYDLSGYSSPGGEPPYIRADWLVAKALRPPLYHDLLGLASVAVIERASGIDGAASRLARAGLAHSGVATGPRLVEWLDAPAGSMFWRAYDLRPGTDLAASASPRAGSAYEGSELLFSLPNGLPAFLMADARGERRDVAPEGLLVDPQATAGDQRVVSGLSCIACHRLGVVRGEAGAGREGEETPADAEKRRKDAGSDPSKEQMGGSLLRDEERFHRALAIVLGPFLSSGEDLADLPEPIGAAARAYGADLGITEVACELGVADAVGLRDEIARQLPTGIKRLRELEPLTKGGTIRRATWDSLENVQSLFQSTARALGRGVPTDFR